MKEEKMLLPFEIKIDAAQSDGSFEGYGSTFGGAPDSYGDIVIQGAFKDSLKKNGRNGNGIAMLWQHDSKVPVGVWDRMEENSKGLFVQGKVAINTSLGKDVFELAKMGAIKGLSIGYSPEEWEFDAKKQIRYLKKVDLWEISLVTFPANTRATITAVKSLLQNAKNERELEEGLRESGLSSSAAVYIASLLKDKLFERVKQKQQDESMKLLLEKIKSVNSILTKGEKR